MLRAAWRSMVKTSGRCVSLGWAGDALGGVNPATHDVVTAELTLGSVTDGEVFPDLLNQLGEQELGKVYGEGGYVRAPALRLSLNATLPHHPTAKRRRGMGRAPSVHPGGTGLPGGQWARAVEASRGLSPALLERDRPVSIPAAHRRRDVGSAVRHPTGGGPCGHCAFEPSQYPRYAQEGLTAPTQANWCAPDKFD